MARGIGIVQTKFGKISGVEAEEDKYLGITYFKGIPYATPPVGELRFKPPVDLEAWDGVKRCDTYAARAMQPDMGGLAAEPYASDFYWMGTPPVSEDCLYLNVTTGAMDASEKRPVFMWFHGGGLGGGHSFEIEFENSELARKGIVVVTVAQRLNVFGYLALPQLSAEQGGTSGNYGFMDEVKALDWVYENIASFGGDPENITVGGQSGGTMKSGALAASPMQKGRVKRVINQSNLNWVGRPLQTMEDAEKRGIEFLKSKGIDPEISLDELRKLPSDLFYGKTLSPIDMGIGTMTYDSIYMKYPEIYQGLAEYAGDCDYISGGTYGESSMRPVFGFDLPPVSSAKEFYELAREQLGDLYEKYDFEKLCPCTDENADHTSRWYAALGISSFGGVIVNRYFGAYRKAHGMKGNTYSYLFSHVTPSRPEEKGTKRDADKLLAWHSSDLWYTFASLREGVPPARPWTALDFELADKISSYWANFMKTGDPNGAGLPEWPKSDENYGYMILGDKLEGHVGLDSDLDKMLCEYAAAKKNLPK